MTTKVLIAVVALCVLGSGLGLYDLASIMTTPPVSFVDFYVRFVIDMFSVVFGITVLLTALAGISFGNR